MATLPYPAVSSIASEANIASGAPIAWQVSDPNALPVGVALDETSRTLYFASPSSGSLFQIGPDGKALPTPWLQGLNQPTGLRGHKGKLFCVGGNQFSVIDFKTAAIEKQLTVESAQNLTDVVIDGAGVAYLADPTVGAIYIVEKDLASVFVDGESSDRPTGLMIMGNQIFVASEGSAAAQPGMLFALNLKTKQKTVVTPTGVGKLVGLTRDERFNFLVAERTSGTIYQISPKGEVTLLMAGVNSPGGILFLTDRRLLIVTRPEDHSVTAFDITRLRR